MIKYKGNKINVVGKALALTVALGIITTNIPSTIGNGEKSDVDRIQLTRLNTNLAADNTVLIVDNSNLPEDIIKTETISRGKNPAVNRGGERSGFVKLPERVDDRQLELDKIVNPMSDEKVSDALQQAEDLREDIAKRIKEEEEMLRFVKEKINEAQEQVRKRESETSLAGYEVPQIDTSFKSYMDYRTITSTSSKQYKLQSNPKVYSDDEGFRRMGEDYMIAVGTYYAKEVGPRLRITLTTGKQFTAVVGEIKADIHTDSKNQHREGNVVEFIVDTRKMDIKVKDSGNMSTAPKAGLVGGIKSIELIGYVE